MASNNAQFNKQQTTKNGWLETIHVKCGKIGTVTSELFKTIDESRSYVKFKI